MLQVINVQIKVKWECIDPFHRSLRPIQIPVNVSCSVLQKIISDELSDFFDKSNLESWVLVNSVMFLGLYWLADHT